VDIILKVNFEFVDYTGDKELAGGREKPLHIDYLREKWENAKKQPWIDLFKQKIAQIWDGKFQMRCIRPGWDGIVAIPHMEIREVQDGQQHFKIKVDKATLINDNGTQKLTTQGGSSNVDSEKMIAQLREFDLVDKIADPSVHEYLHKGEATHVNNAYKTDRDLLKNMLTQFGRLEYQGRSSATLLNPAMLRNLIDAIKRTEIPSKLAHLHPIVLETSTGTVPSDRRLAARRARLLKMQLTNAGIRNPTQIKQVAGTFNGIVAQNAPEDDNIKAAFIRNWSRISAAHEFGHMIGLVDEYNPAASTEMVKKMVSDGLLPPNTPGQHLTGKGTSYGGQAGKQAGFARLLEDTNLTSPNFDPTKGAAEVMSTSLMTSGYEVMAQHYVTFWEALTKMTETHLDKKYWEIV